MTLPRMDETQPFLYSQGNFGPCELAGLFELSTVLVSVVWQKSNTYQEDKEGECRKEERRKKYNSTKKKLAGMREK